jgi:hypothetical protein
MAKLMGEFVITSILAVNALQAVYFVQYPSAAPRVVPTTSITPARPSSPLVSTIFSHLALTMNGGRRQSERVGGRSGAQRMMALSTDSGIPISCGSRHYVAVASRPFDFIDRHFQPTY